MFTSYLSYDMSIKFVTPGNISDTTPKKSQKLRNKKIKEKHEYDILQIDNQIKLTFMTEKSMIPEYKKRINSMIKTLNTVKVPYGIDEKIEKEITELKDIYNIQIDLSGQKLELSFTYRDYLNLFEQVKKTLNRIRNIESDALFNYYTFLTTQIIDEYKNILSKPIKRSFMNKIKSSEITDNRKQELLQQYLTIASKFIDIDYYQEEKEETNPACENCGNNSNFEILEGRRTCEECGLEIIITCVQTSFKDVERVNLHNRYKYEKISHFKEGVSQYQGKQNKVIDEYVYVKAKEWLALHGLVNEKGKTKQEKFAAVKKEHLRLFISESDDKRITNHYEDLHLIYSELTGRPCADISHLEESLFQKFEKLVEAFLTLEDIPRINFLNTQFVLRKLLLMENYKINKDDFPGLKTKERQKDHEHLFGIICSIAGFNNVPD